MEKKISDGVPVWEISAEEVDADIDRMVVRPNTILHVSDVEHVQCVRITFEDGTQKLIPAWEKVWVVDSDYQEQSA